MKLEFSSSDDMGMDRALNECVEYDLHVHTTCSDGTATPEEIVQKADDLGIGVSITDHNEIRGSIRAHRENRARVVPGIEVSSRRGLDTLVYFNDFGQLENYYVRCVEPHKGIDPSSFTTLDILEVLEGAKKFGGFSVIAHPFGLAWKNWNRVLKIHGARVFELVEGVECMNGCLSPAQNQRAYKLAKIQNKPMTGGSDSHTIATLGGVRTMIPEVLADDPIDAIRTCRSFVSGQRSLFIPRANESIQMIRKHMRYWPKIVAKKMRIITNG